MLQTGLNSRPTPKNRTTVDGTEVPLSSVGAGILWGMADELGGERLRQLAAEWGDWDPTNPAGANRLFDQVHAAAKALSATESGKAAISGLLTDEDANVRLCAATYALRWDEAEARRALEDIRDSDRSLRAVTAKWTLREWDSGRLSLDY